MSIIGKAINHKIAMFVENLLVLTVSPQLPCCMKNLIATINDVLLERETKSGIDALH